MTLNLLKLSGLSLLLLFGLIGCKTETSNITSISSSEVVKPLEAVSALGQLNPFGEIRKLAAPTSGFGGTPRIEILLVEEGDKVVNGQVLAIFDNRSRLLADLKKIEAKIETLTSNIEIKSIEVNRFQQATIEGASSIVLLEEKKNQLIKYKGQRNEALAEKIGIEEEIKDSELKSPIDGVILRIISREGERPGVDGVLEIGANQLMEALIEVYESDINRVKIEQDVHLVSENGGFSGQLFGKVVAISPQVRQRRVLSTDPTGDADARVIEVRVKLDTESSQLVRNLTGMKVIARFKSI